MENSLFDSVKKFFSPKEEVIEHWFCLVDGFQFVTADFYERVENELTTRKVPGLEISRIEFSEGGMLSDKREYLRLRRERLVFDICAAPFGTSYFFSFRFVELPFGIKPLELLMFLGAVAVAFWLFTKLLGTMLGFLVFGVICGVGIYVLRNALALGIKNLDANLMKMPVIGPFYEASFRKETYYRQDTRLMYLTTANDITQMLVSEVTAAQGIKLLKQYGRKPPGGDLYQATTKRLDANDDTPKPRAELNVSP